MKRTLSVLISLAVAVCSFAQTAAEPGSEPATVWHDGSEFPIFGKATELTESPYDRLPESYQSLIRKRLWNLGRNTAGLYIRFHSDSPTIKLQWTSRFGVMMNHMTDTGVRGLDLYYLADNGQWRFARNGRPSKELFTEATVISNMEAKPREWMLYLPLYDGLKDLKIGVDSLSYIGPPQVNSPAAGNQIVFYGSSIMQGGCVSRPGVLATSIISRELDQEVINLGFSGNAHLDEEIAQLMAQVESPSLFVLDYVPNSTAEMIQKSGEKFFDIIRTAHPNTPVIFVERPIYPHSMLDKAVADDIKARNAAQKALYKHLRKSGHKKLYYLEGEKILGKDGEGTVDGVHSNDTGAQRYVDAILPLIKKAL